jgi:cellulose synthase/poly-beta-1,6-N-acetylglucosamine synthase-like glycosyltransferase
MSDPAETGDGVSVVITTHNEAAGIGGTLEGLKRELPGAEIVVVDDRSTDGTADLVYTYLGPKLRLLIPLTDESERLTTRQQALDHGFRAATGDILITVDADSQFRPGGLAALLAPIRRGAADAVAGPVAFDGPGPIALWQSCDAAHYIMWCSWLVSRGGEGGALFGNFAFRKALYADIGGFEALGGSVTEDLQFVRAVQRHGARLRYARSDALVHVAAEPNLGALIRRTLRITRAPLSPLALFLSAWPLSLPIFGILALFIPGALPVFLSRLGLGAAVTLWAVARYGPRRALPFAPLYEPLVFALALAAIPGRLRSSGVDWGGKTYRP